MKDELQSQEHDSDSIGILESCVKSDIDRIIKKMYTPMVDGPSNGANENSFHGLVDAEGDGYYRPVISDSGDNSEKRFGFYFETVTRNHNRASVLDSSTSGSVSVPVVRKKLRNSRLICECCKMKISNRLSSKGHCRICKQPTTVPTHTYLAGQQNIDRATIKHGQGDDVSDGCNKIYQNPVYGLKTALNSSSKFNQVIKGSSSRIMIPRVDEGEEKLQIVPDIDVDEAKIDLEKQGRSQVYSENSQATSKTFFKRVVGSFSAWSVGFQNKNKSNKDIVNRKNSLSMVTEEIVSKNGLTSSKYHGTFERNTDSNCGGVMDSIEDVEVASRHNGERKNIIRSGFQFKKKDIGRRGKIKRKTLETLTENPSFVPDSESEMNIMNLERSDFQCIESVPDPMTKVSNLSLSFIAEQNDDISLNDWENSKGCQTDSLSKPSSNEIIKKVSIEATEFWADVFRPLHTVSAFVTGFILQLLKLCLRSLINPLVWGTMELWSEYLFKPCLTLLFNGVLKPVFGFLQNIASSVSDLCFPLAECFGHFLMQFSKICGSCRLVEVHKTYKKNDV